VDDKLKIILAELRSLLETFYGERLMRIVLFGSQARGDAEPGSDIDVLVVLGGDVSPAEEIDRTSEILANLSLQFSEVVSCVFIDEERFIHRNGPLLRNIRREGVAV